MTEGQIQDEDHVWESPPSNWGYITGCRCKGCKAAAATVRNAYTARKRAQARAIREARELARKSK